MRKIEIINSEHLRSDIGRMLARTGRLSDQDRSWFARVYIREVLREGYYLLDREDSERLFVLYEPSDQLTREAASILDWLAELALRDPQLHGKLPRVTFAQALQHSERWHRSLRSKATKRERYIGPDSRNAPEVLDLGDGWAAFWLKTDHARDLEGAVMGHCVGNGSYDGLASREAVLSIRRYNRPHVTFHLKGPDIRHSASRGNDRVPERYQRLMRRTAALIGVRLLLYGRPDNAQRPRCGRHEAEDGSILYLEAGLLHRSDGAALIFPDGVERRYIKGRLHCQKGPAVTRPDGTQEWYLNDVRHREEGPAIIHPDGSEAWFLNGRLHRKDGPALINSNLLSRWYRHGELHREDGPAVIQPDGLEAWYLNGRLQEPSLLSSRP